jgi:hypothetical protein
MKEFFEILDRALELAKIVNRPGNWKPADLKRMADNGLTDLGAIIERAEIKTDLDIPRVLRAVGAFYHIAIGVIDVELGPTSNDWYRTFAMHIKLLEAEREQFMEAVNGKSS